MKKYSLFIAYHGTNSSDGTYEIAKQLCDYLSQENTGFNVYLHGYASLPEHQNIQWNRTWEIIDDCQCFLAIVNENVPRNAQGKLGNDNNSMYESQIRSEVDTFYDLICRNMRGRDDFNFLYAGSALKGKEQESFFRELHSQILNGHNHVLSWESDTILQNFGIVSEWLSERGIVSSPEDKQLRKLRSLLEGLGWGRSILFSPKELLTYERKISIELKHMSLIAAHTTDDVKGGTIFPLVEENLSKGIKYTYLFFNYPGARKQLENIFYSHSVENRKRLSLKLIKNRVWICGDILLIKIYEYNSDRKSEIFFRIKMSTDNKSEQCIYVKVDENKVPVIQQEIEELLEEDISVETLNENGWEKM